MRKIKYKKGRKLLPYNLEYTGQYKEVPPQMQLFVYNNEELTEYPDLKITDLDKSIVLQKTNWLNLHGLNDNQLIQALGKYFNIDNFILADILNTTKRTKLQEQSDILFFNIKSLLPTENSDNISVEQISFLIKNEILISFQEKRSDFFAHIRERMRKHAGIVRTKKADYLLYILLDAVMENFYITIENEEDKVENLINLLF
jgi:magnesium transporter